MKRHSTKKAGFKTSNSGLVIKCSDNTTATISPDKAHILGKDKYSGLLCYIA